MAESTEGSAGKSAVTGAQKTKGRRVQGGRVVESRYLDYEKKTKKLGSEGRAQAQAALDRDGTRFWSQGYSSPSVSMSPTVRQVSISAAGKPPEGRKTSALPRSKEDSRVMGRGNLQSTMLEGHGTAPLDLDLSAINDKSMFREPPQLDRTASEKSESTSFTTPQRKRTLHKKRRDLQQTMDMMESQTLLLTLLSVKMEENLALLEEKAERDLAAMCREKERLQGRVLELRHQLLLRQKHQELAASLDAQMEVLGPFQAVAEHFKEQYKTLATALDTTRHELPMQAIHVQGSGQELLDDLQPALRTTLQLLSELGICSQDSTAQVLCLLEELRDLTTKKDLELHRIMCQVLELSSQASKEAALVNQEVWEEAQGPPTCSQWYFSPDALGDHSSCPGQD